ncbi:hypothetical protein [Microvirga zambiensis]|nr:hypothetical protein [Microvirga zambiensis]
MALQRKINWNAALRDLRQDRSVASGKRCSEFTKRHIAKALASSKKEAR